MRSVIIVDKGAERYVIANVDHDKPSKMVTISKNTKRKGVSATIPRFRYICGV